jgi:hypothetical protein
MTEQRCYLSYLVRLWQTERDGEIVWLATAENPHTTERQAFAGLEALFAFLEEKTNKLASDRLAQDNPFPNRQTRNSEN